MPTMLGASLRYEMFLPIKAKNKLSAHSDPWSGDDIVLRQIAYIRKFNWIY
jgi:hypothetical protein